MEENNKVTIQGAKGGQTSRTPVEAPNTLRSIAYARILDLISEGPIVGLVDGLKSIYLDETPVQNSDDTLNFKSVQIDTRTGTADQDYIPGFPEVENEILMNVELRSDTPWTRSYTNLNLSAIRVTLSVLALSKANTENGDINGHSVRYAIDIATDGGAFESVMTGSFTGKCTTKYERSHRIDLPPATSTGWIVRVRRLTANANSSSIADTTMVESTTEIIDAKLRYPMSAVVGISMDASQFQNIPSRAYDVKGRIIRVPVNYDPVARTYTGVWDGTFKLAWTDNPAWCFYDLCTNERYGLGHVIGDGLISKWSLYQIGQYCDQLVPDGRGGEEPRFTCNLFLQSQADAYKVIQDMASIFRGMTYWSGGQIVTVGDMPEDSIYTYNTSNVIDGQFNYQGSPRKTRYTTALVSWNDTKNFGRSKVEYVDDPEGLARYGVQQTDLTAVGCSSQGQAQRVGRYALLTAQYETDVVTFSVGLDGVIAAPGQIVKIADPMRAGKRIGGRIVSALGATQVVLDSELDATYNVGDTLTVVMPTALAEERAISLIASDRKTITVSPGFSAIPVAGAVWAIESDELVTQTFRVISVTEQEGLKFEIGAVEHNPSKFAYIDNGTRLEDLPNNQLPENWQAPPTNVVVSVTEVAGQVVATTMLNVSWDEPAGAVEYDVEVQINEQAWVSAGKTSDRNVSLSFQTSGSYLVRVRAINANGIYSVPAYSETASVPDHTTNPGVIDDIITDVGENTSNISQEIIDRIAGDAAEAAARAAALAAEASARAADIAAEVTARNAAIVAAVDAEATARGAAIAVEEAARIAADNALAASITALGAASQFEAFQKWEFDTTAESWTASNATLSNNNGALRVTSTSSTFHIESPVLSVDGSKYPLIRLMVKKVSGTDTWGGVIYYKTAGHDFEVPHRKEIAKPAGWDTNEWCVIDLDMADLTAGGNDYVTNTITGLRFNLTSGSGVVLDYDWIAMGKLGVGLTASALQTLETRVSNAEGDISTLSTAMTNLEADFTDVENAANAATAAVSLLDARVTSAEGELTSQGAAITTLNSNLQNIGGDNLLYNAGFETDTDSDGIADGWVQAGAGVTGTVASLITNTAIANTKKAQRLACTTMSNTGYLNVRSDTTLGAQVEPGKVYTLSVYGRATNGLTVRQYVQWLDIADAVVREDTVVNGTADGLWHRYVWTPPAVPAGAVKARVYPFRGLNSTGADVPNAFVECDNAMLQEGTVATNWVPSMVSGLDLQATALSALTTRVTTAEGLITSQATSITSLNAQLGASPNLLKNPSGEFGTTDWVIVSGGGAISPENNTDTGTRLRFTFTTAAGRFTTGEYPVGGGGLPFTIAMSCYRANPSAVPIQINIRFYNAANTLLGETPRTNIPGSTNARPFTRFVSSGTSPSGTTKMVVNIERAAGVAEDLYVHLAKLEQSPVATMFTSDRAMYQSASATSALDARVTSAEGTITSQASAITNLKASVAGGVNLIKNAGIEVDATGYTTNTSGGTNWDGAMTFNLAGANWHPPGINSLGRSTTAGKTPSTTEYMDIRPAAVPITAGTRYCFSAYLGAHRCTGRVIAVCTDASGATLSTTYGSILDNGASGMQPAAGGMGLEAWFRSSVVFTAPANTKSVTLICRFNGYGTAQPYGWVIRPQLEEMTTEQVGPGPWNPGGAGLDAQYAAITSSLETRATTLENGQTQLMAKAGVTLDVNGYITGWALNNNGSSGTFTVLASNFTIVSPGGGARTEYSSGNWRVYDSAGTLRVRMGVW